MPRQPQYVFSISKQLESVEKVSLFTILSFSRVITHDLKHMMIAVLYYGLFPTWKWLKTFFIRRIILYSTRLSNIYHKNHRTMLLRAVQITFVACFRIGYLNIIKIIKIFVHKRWPCLFSLVSTRVVYVLYKILII